MKFNIKQTIRNELKNNPNRVDNYEGGMGFNVDPLTELYMRAATCLVGEPKFYESADFADQELIRATHKVLETNPEFVLQLAVYCRERMHLRSVPLVLCAEYANMAPGTVPNARKYITRVIQRADELYEIIAYQFERNKISPRKTKLPMVIKAGVRDAFQKFDQYALGKYNRKGAVKLRDALFLTHPKPQNTQQKQDWDNLAAGTLKTPVTWETQRSAGLMTWSEVIHNVFHKDGKINNYMAILRNLRNIMQSEDVTNTDIELVCSMLSTPEAVRKSKQLPFRFLSAHRIVKEMNHAMTNSVLDALEDAAAASVDNMPRLAGTTLIACDVSGSMTWTPISKNSSVYPYDIGILLGSMAHKFCNTSITGIFGTDWKQIPMSRRSGILSNVNEMHRHDNDVGWGTNGHKVIEYLLENNIQVDRIMIFTDCQMWDSYSDQSFAPTYIKYQRKCPDTKLYLFNLSGYGNIIVPQDTKNVHLIAGWSDRVLEYIQTSEQTGTSAIERIRAIKP